MNQYTIYMHVICDVDNIKGGRAVKEQSFCMSLRLNWYQYKTECHNFRTVYIIPMVTTIKISIENTQLEMKRESKLVTIRNKLNTKKERH